MDLVQRIKLCGMFAEVIIRFSFDQVLIQPIKKFYFIHRNFDYVESEDDLGFVKYKKVSQE